MELIDVLRQHIADRQAEIDAIEKVLAILKPPRAVSAPKQQRTTAIKVVPASCVCGAKAGHRGRHRGDPQRRVIQDDKPTYSKVYACPKCQASTRFVREGLYWVCMTNKCEIAVGLRKMEVDAKAVAP